MRVIEPPPIPPAGVTYLTRIRWNANSSHWIVQRDGIIYDPVLAGPAEAWAWWQATASYGWPTSYAEVLS